MLEGKIALITGAGSGIGRATAQVCAGYGATVWCTDVSDEAAEQAAAAIRATGGSAHGCRLDVADAAACRAIAERVATESGNASILVNCAGVSLRSAIGDPDALATWDRTMAVNAAGAYNTIVALGDQLKRSRGAVINISSAAALATLLNSPAYTASKAAMIGMTRSLAVELGPDGVRVNVIAPGVIVTPMSSVLNAKSQSRATLMGRTPLGHFGEPEDIAQAVAFLASDRARFITGAVLSVDGGLAAA